MDTSKWTDADRAALRELVWGSKHKDYRGGKGADRTVLVMNPKTGGTESWPLTALTDEMLVLALQYVRPKNEKQKALLTRLGLPFKESLVQLAAAGRALLG